MSVFRHPVRFVLAGVMLAFIVGVTPASAATVNLHYIWEVSDVFDTGGYLTGLVVQGDQVTIDATWDTSGADALPADPTIGRYDPAPASMSFDFGDGLVWDAATPGDSIDAAVFNLTGGGDELQYRSFGGFPVSFPSANLQQQMLFFGDSTGAAWATDALMDATPDLTKFDNIGVAIYCHDTTSENGYTIVVRPPVGRIDGVVRDLDTGTPIAGATVTLGSRTFTTGADGRYWFNYVEPGSPSVSASAAGHVTSTEAVAVTKFETSSRWFSLGTAAPPEVVSTPASSLWSLGLAALMGLGATAMLRRVRADV